MMDPSDLSANMARIQAEIKTLDSDILNDFPVCNYVRLFDDYPQTADYNYVTEDVRRYCNEISKRGGDHLLNLYHELLLITLMTDAPNKLSVMNLPEDVVSIFHMNFKRILEKIKSGSDDGFMYANDSFNKDLSVCGLRMIPTGSRKMHLSTLSKRFIFKKGFGQFIRSLYLISFEFGGFSPFYEVHTDSKDPDLLAEFNYDGFVRTYVRIANILKTHKHVKGIFGVSWFYDPQIEHVSPRLSYLREIIVNNGGHLFYIGPDEHSKHDALLKSETRRRLYQEGKYIPTSYLYVWSRKKIISWADHISTK